jgi:hypothetical protein
MALSVGACSGGSKCKNVNMDPLLAGAASVRVDIYDAGSASCEGGLLKPGAGPPLVSQKFAGGQTLQLSLPQGSRVVVVSTFSDSDGTMRTSSACSNVTLSSGKSSCLQITLIEIDAGSLDFSMPPMGCQAPADCSSVHGTPQCAGGTCSWTCDAGFAHCGSDNTGCETDITTVENCGGCGNACGTANATANHCMGGQCTYDCASGFLDCVKLGFNADGCESATSSVNTCGACGTVCDTAHSVGTACDGTKCTYTGCMAGYADCDTMGANANGCEFVDAPHDVGVNSLTYMLACTPPGTPGAAGTYSVAMAQAACGAWTSSVGGGSCAAFTCTGNTSCIQSIAAGMCVTWSYTKSTAGHVSIMPSPTCTSPNTGSATWN